MHKTTKRENFNSSPPFSKFSNKLTHLPIIHHIPFEKIPITSIQLPPLSQLEREMLKLFLWYDLYIYLSQTLNASYKEDDMFNPKIIRVLIIDLMKDEDHTLAGIGYATHIPEDVLHDILSEINTNPSISVTTKIIEYYIIVKRQEYTEFIRRIFQGVEYKSCN